MDHIFYVNVLHLQNIFNQSQNGTKAPNLVTLYIHKTNSCRSKGTFIVYYHLYSLFLSTYQVEVSQLKMVIARYISQLCTCYNKTVIAMESPILM
jgi:hypothetical protein